MWIIHIYYSNFKAVLSPRFVFVAYANQGMAVLLGRTSLLGPGVSHCIAPNFLQHRCCHWSTDETAIHVIWRLYIYSWTGWFILMLLPYSEQEWPIPLSLYWSLEAVLPDESILNIIVMYKTQCWYCAFSISAPIHLTHVLTITVWQLIGHQLVFTIYNTNFTSKSWFVF